MGKKKPKVICHMMSTVDGRLLTDRYTEPHGDKTKDDFYKEYYDIAEHELKCNVILNGRKTVEIHYMSKFFDNQGYKPASEPKIFKAVNPPTEWTQIILDPKGKTLYENIPETDHVITVLSEQVSDEYLTHLRKQNVSYLFAGKDGIDYHTALEILYLEFNIKEILLEGGAIINGVFLKDGLIDELSLTMYPGIDGLAGMPTIFEYIGKDNDLPARGQTLELKFAKPYPSGLVWLYYKFHKK